MRKKPAPTELILDTVDQDIDVLAGVKQRVNERLDRLAETEVVHRRAKKVHDRIVQHIIKAISLIADLEIIARLPAPSQPAGKRAAKKTTKKAVPSNRRRVREIDPYFTIPSARQVFREYKESVRLKAINK